MLTFFNISNIENGAINYFFNINNNGDKFMFRQNLNYVSIISPLQYILANDYKGGFFYYRIEKDR